MNAIEILLNDSRGVYIPHNFADMFNMDDWGVSESDRAVLIAGPSYKNDWYWETWENVLSKAFYTDKSGNVWRLSQEGDLFAYCVELMTDREYADFFGEERETD